jgi:hypothetical protein
MIVIFSNFRQSSIDMLRRVTALAVLTFPLVLLSGVEAHATAPCDYYASPSGGGTGLSQASPFRIIDSWSVLTPGKTLCLLDGVYEGHASMLSPGDHGLKSGNPSGQPGNPITIRALNDGKVLLDGQYARRPIWLRGNDHVVIEGINACCSNMAVIALSSNATNNIFRRVGAWDAYDGGVGSASNNHVWDISNSANNLIEDSFGFGTGRYILVTYDSGSRKGKANTIRRFWARWEGYDSQMGPRAPLQLSYNSHQTLCENCIATWSGERQTAPFGCCSFGIGGGAPPVSSYPNGPRVLGTIGYVKAGASIPSISFLGPEAGGSHWTFKDTVVAIDPSLTRVSPAGLHGCGKKGCRSAVAQDLTLIGGRDSTISSQWDASNIAECNSPDGCPSVFTAATAANVCTRYVNGVKTGEALWPWPMNQRIAEATEASGHTPEDVTATIESLFGTIPPQCQAR